MAENVRSPFDYREPPTLDSDGDGSKPPPPRGRVCGRKRKGTPVKVCDPAYVTEDEEEESLSEHSYSPGDGQYPEGAEDRLPPPGSPYYLADPSQLCVPELGEDGSSGVRGPVLFHPPPNCRIREVHCGSQVRLVVIAIRDIAKGEEITVDYSLTDWGENAMEEEAGPHPLSLSEMRGRMLRRRKKRKIAAAVSAKKKTPAAPAPPPAATSSRGPGRPCSSFPRPGAAAPPPTRSHRRQHCPYCGRHYRSLARHLEKHHAGQPEVRAAMELAHLHGHATNGSHASASAAPHELVSAHRHHVPPLLSSLSCLVLYLRRQQHASFLALTRTPHSAEAWRLLCHCSLSLLILYNRHRECERHVLCHLPRAGVVGKRGRVQPLILPPHSESCLELLLRTGPNVGVDPSSPYVFSRPYHSPATPLRGTDLLRNLARASGAKNPTALTGTRRLEEFLEREYHVTQNCSAIVRDAALMARVGRVVLYGEREGVLFRGMSLQHICLELDVMSGHSGDSFSDDSDKKGPGRPPRKKRGVLLPPPVSMLPASHKRRSVQPKSGKRGVLKRPWSEAERVAVETHLKRNIVELRVPAKADCERCLELCPLLVSNHRDWRSIKFYVHNRIQLLKKQGRRESGC
ncbi:hypothetical protein NHX12_013834 [Muraenolepis orangiensis]|uniref:SET domain-containing protein n=1 Tax=Muraenolepis orangiensis TaxID=630683 RepID=A0A9Q0DBD0_9TELE|nr:hypothetical protein NHX12_013834 [Muraenolepis orangiensis]